MRHQAARPLALLTLVISACTLGPAWPSGYREAVCTATDHLRAADVQLTAAVRAVVAAEPEQVAVAAGGMGHEAADARAALERAPDWMPGAELIRDLGQAASDFGRAADQFSVGARQGNGPAIDGAVAAARDAQAAVARAELEGDRLRDASGWEPC